jgi:hypothetical protein
MSVTFIKCPYHEEDTASMAVYPDGGAYCFGCSSYTTASDLGIKSLPPPTIVENLLDSKEYIDSLPTLTIRGLELPADELGYYIVWPDGSYYKKRLWDESKGRYRCPTGHQKPALWCRDEGSDTLYIIEGELNAISFCLAVDKGSVVSPGGATDFTKHISDYTRFKNIVIVADKDTAGTIAAIETKASLLKHTSNVRVILVERDFNDLLRSENGIAEIKKAVGL